MTQLILHNAILIEGDSLVQQDHHHYVASLAGP